MPPKITLEHINAQIVADQYYVFPGTTVTVCCITLVNGFTTVGHSACVDPAMFDASMGEQIAYDNAFEQIWQLEGYRLKQAIHEGSVTVESSDE